MINIFKEQKGITLITLIITVVLLIIITATIAINSHTSLELSNLTKLENDIQALNDRIATYYVKNGTLPVTSDTYTKKELSLRITNLSPNDGDTYYRIDLSKLDNITLNYGNNTYIINETSHNIYNLDGVVYDEKVYYTVGNDEEMISVIDHEYFTQEQISNMIGKYVDYTPEQGTYSLITNRAEYAGTTTNTSDFTTENLGWRIWGIDGNILTLISADTTRAGGAGNGRLRLQGAAGYNNGVRILNDICYICYSNSAYGATGRSINIEDIESVMDKNVWRPEDFSRIPYGETKKYYTYGEEYSYTENKKYPYIWQFEEYAKIIDDNRRIENIKGEGISQSTQENYYTGNIYTIQTADVSINPIMTFYYRNATTNDYINTKYYDLLYNIVGIDSNVLRYWVASHCVTPAHDTEKKEAIFLIRTIYDHSINGQRLYNSSGSTNGFYQNIRPMVEINLTQVSLDTTTTTGADAANAYKLVKK